MLRTIFKQRVTTYMGIVCVVYILMVFVFLTDISPEVEVSQTVTQAKSTKQLGVLDHYKDLLQLRLENADVGETHDLAIVNSAARKCIGKQTVDDFQFKEVFKDVFIYSAFIDVRDNDFEHRANGSSVIRLMAILPVKKEHPKLYCLGVLKSGQHWSEQITFYEMCENHKLRYGSFILSCRLPKELWQKPPCSVLVSSSTVPSKTSEWFKVHSSMKTRPHKLEVCVPPLFGKIDVIELIEFIELTRLFGAERIHFYDAGVSPSILTVLSYYRKHNIVSVLPWKLDDRLKKKKQLHYNGQSANVQDCLYRNMFATRYLAFMDIDETIVPRKHSKLFPMITSVANYSQYAGFSIVSAFFDPHWEPENSNNKSIIGQRVKLRRLTDVMRTKTPSRIRTKCIVNPWRIFEIGIHHVSKPIMATLQTVSLPGEYVLIHHYRVCDWRYGTNCVDHVQDNTLLSHAVEFETAVSKVLATLSNN